MLSDHRKLRRAHELVLSDRVQHLYPQLAANIVERMFRVDNPAPKPGHAAHRAWRSASGPAPRSADLARDAWTGVQEVRVSWAPERWPALSFEDLHRHDPASTCTSGPTSSSTATSAATARTRDCVVACPAKLFVPDRRRRDPLQLRAVLRVRHLLPRLQPRGRDLVVLPRGRPRGRLPPLVISRLPGSGSATTTRWAGVSAADEAALEVALRLAERDGAARRGSVVSVGPPGAERGLREALAAAPPGPCASTRPASWPAPPSRAALAAVAGGCDVGAVRRRVATTAAAGRCPAFLAAELGRRPRPSGSSPSSSPTGRGRPLTAIRRLDGGRREVLACRRPAVLSVEGAVAAAAAGVAAAAELAARHAPIEVVAGADGPDRTTRTLVRPYRPRARVPWPARPATPSTGSRSLTAAGRRRPPRPRPSSLDPAGRRRPHPRHPAVVGVPGA